MKYQFSIVSVILVGLLFSCKSNDVEKPDDQIDTPEGYTLVWSDEFDGTSINPVKWTFETGDGTAYGLPAGWGNNELQMYTSSSENAGIQAHEGNSVLAITAREDGSGGYTSARLTAAELGMRYGRIDIRAKMPEGQGLWPALWMIGDNQDLIDWPGCGEIDIAEVLGHEPSIRYSTLHFTNGENSHEEIQNVYELAGSSFSNRYTIFGLEWSPEFLTFTLDGQAIQQVPLEDDMKEFQRSFNLILNVAVGGNWPGKPDNTTVFPQTMFVDYVRVYTKKGFNAPEPPVLDIEEETVGQLIEPSIADHAIREDFTELGGMTVVAYGGGGEPFISLSEVAIDGDSSMVFDFPGGNWGGAYIELASAKNLGSYTYLNFSLHKPVTLVNAEIKLESAATSAAIFLADYSGTAVAEGFVEYKVPLADFTGLDLTAITIPFAIWNPQDASEAFVTATVLIDNIYFSD